MLKHLLTSCYTVQNPHSWPSHNEEPIAGSKAVQWCDNLLCIWVIHKVWQLEAENGQQKHQTRNWERKFYKAKELGSKVGFPPILVVNWVSSCLSSLLTASTAATIPCIFTAPTCTTTVITLEPCAWNAKFQHFRMCLFTFYTH